MLIRKFVGTDERALLKRIRAEMGPDPVILHTAFVKPKGPFRFLRRPHVEIVAGSGFAVVKDYPRNKPSAAAATPPAPVPAVPRAPAAVPAPDAFLNRMQGEIRELKQMVAEQGELMRHEKLQGVPEDLAPEFAALAGSEMSQHLARRLLRRLQEKLPADALKNRAAVRSALKDALRELIRCADGIALQPDRCVRIAFVGPTGVGKTTTIAKLMAIYAHQGREVGVITNDTYRIAAADQIKRVAEIVGVPLRICRGREEIAAAVKEFSNRDLVLLDTAGRSQNNGRRIEELREVLDAAQVDETHLVLSVTTHLRTILDVVEKFQPCGFNRIVLTKLDEAVKVGLILDVLSKVGRELSFITTGQEIPRDIEIADAARLTSLILGEEAVA